MTEEQIKHILYTNRTREMNLKSKQALLEEYECHRGLLRSADDNSRVQSSPIQESKAIIVSELIVMLELEIELLLLAGTDFIKLMYQIIANPNITAEEELSIFGYFSEARSYRGVAKVIMDRLGVYTHPEQVKRNIQKAVKTYSESCDRCDTYV